MCAYGTGNGAQQKHPTQQEHALAHDTVEGEHGGDRQTIARTVSTQDASSTVKTCNDKKASNACAATRRQSAKIFVQSMGVFTEHNAISAQTSAIFRRHNARQLVSRQSPEHAGESIAT